MKTSSFGFKTFVFLLFLFFCTGIYFTYLSSSLPENIREFWGTGVFYLTSSALASISGFYAAYKFKIESLQGKSLLCLTIGFFCWFLGDVIFFVYDNFVNITPYPSVADVLYLLGYPIFLLGIFWAVKNIKIKWSLKRIIISSMLFLIFAAIIVYNAAVYFQSASLLEDIVSIGYWIGNIMIILSFVLLLNIVFAIKFGKESKTWLIMAFAMLIGWAADTLFIFYIDSYNAFNWFFRSIDILFILEYLLMAYAFYRFVSIAELQNKSQKKKSRIR